MENTTSNETSLKELELNALLEVTQAINNNLPEDSLYKIYKFTMLANFNVQKLALFVHDDKWDCKVNFGTTNKINRIELPSFFTSLKKMTRLNGESNDFKEFDIAIPVLHKNKLLAVMFVGDIKKYAMSSSLETGTTFLEALTNIILVAIENKKLVRQQLEQEAMKKELEIAQQVQQFLFPKVLPETDQLHIAAQYLPHHNVGGDYYDYLPLNDGKFIICIADVSGKGIPAALIMSNFQASLHTLVRKTANLKEIVEDLNIQINYSGNGESFITFFIALYNPKDHSLEYINCGHNLPLISIDNEGAQLLDLGTTVLGMFNPLPFNNKGRFENITQFTLFCYTDGLTESENDNGEEFGPEILEELMDECIELSPNEINLKMLQSVDDFRKLNPYKDDVTLLTCKVDYKS